MFIFFFCSDAVKINPIGKNIHEGKIIEFIGKNLIYAKDRCVGRSNRSKNQGIPPQEEDTSNSYLEI